VRLTTAALTAVLFFVPEIAFGENLPSVASYGDRVVVHRDIAFSTEGHQKLDLYLPRSAGTEALKPLPVVVCWFGGAFVGGNKEGMAKVAAFLADKGFAAAAPNHIIADPKNGKCGWPQNLYDCKCAVRFLRAHAKKYHLDPERVAGLGHSSGAYLAMMVAFTPDRKDLEGPGGWADQSSRLIAVVNISGVCDRREGLGTGTLNLLGPGYEMKPDLRALASPIVHIRRNSPPVYTLHGAEDKTVLPDSARQLDAALRAAGVEHRLNLMPGLGHNPVTVETFAPVAEWLKEKLRK
jgi:acetyl esterase/lipase